MQNVVGTNKIVEDIVQQNNIHPIVRKVGAAIRLDGLYVLNARAPRDLLDFANGKGMYVKRIDLAGRTHQINNWQYVAARAAAEIQHGES